MPPNVSGAAGNLLCCRRGTGCGAAERYDRLGLRRDCCLTGVRNGCADDMGNGLFDGGARNKPPSSSSATGWAIVRFGSLEGGCRKMSSSSSVSDARLLGNSGFLRSGDGVSMGES